MKHTKLFPILSICLITATCPIVTSCNTGFDGKVTDDEMSKAIDALIDCNSWNVTTDCTITIYDIQWEPIISSNLLNKFTPNGVSSLLSISQSIESSWTKKHEDEWFIIYQTSAEKFTIAEQLGSQPLNTPTLELFKTLKQYKSDVLKSIFNTEHKGYYYLDTTNNQMWYFKFNSNKKIDYLYYVYFDDIYNEYNTYECKNNNYGSTTIEYPFKDEDLNYPAKTKLEYDSTNACYTTKSTTYLRYGCTFTANNNLLKPTKLQILNGETPIEDEITDVCIYVNDEKKNCTCSWDATNHLVNITGLEFNANDKVDLIWNWDRQISPTTHTYPIKLS